MYLTTGRVLAQYQSGTQTRRVPSLARPSPRRSSRCTRRSPPATGSARATGSPLKTRRGRVQLKARLTHSMRLDTLFVPFHWAGPGRANTLTNDALDPDSKIPEFKVAAAAHRPRNQPRGDRSPMNSTPRFIHGVFAFEGKGLEAPQTLGASTRIQRSHRTSARSSFTCAEATPPTSSSTSS